MMNFIIEEKRLDLSVMKCTNELSSLFDMMTIAEAEGNSKLSDLKDKILNIFKKILEALKKFIKDVLTKLDTQVQKFKLNYKLRELKDMLAKKRAKATGQTYNYFDIRKYKKYYSDFINRYVKELKEGLNHDFKSADEYEKWRNNMETKLSDFQYKLSDEEQWKLSVSVTNAVELTDDEARNREKNIKMINEEGSRSIKELEEYYHKADINASMVNYEKFSKYKFDSSFIGKIVNKIVVAIRTVIKFSIKHMFLSIVGLLAILIAL